VVANARAVEAAVVAGELRLDVAELLEIRDEQLLELWMRLVHRLARDGEDLLDVGALEALEQDAFADHPGHTRHDDAHAPGVHRSPIDRSATRRFLEPGRDVGPRIRAEAVRVRHDDPRQRVGVDDKLGADDLVLGQHERGHGIDLVRA